VCFIGAAKTFAQSSDAKVTTSTTPSTSAVVATPAGSQATTVTTGQAIQTPAATKTVVKGEAKKSSCSHSGKSCCMSKEGASKKDCSEKHAEKADEKSENSGTKNN
ncbi:MAG: hypothetical protein ABIT08_07780, partial [Bacteroidia bacterium]